MLVEIFSLYVKGLILSSLTMILICLIWTLWRAKTKRDKTLIERQAFLYEMLMVAILTIPILSFAFMSILVIIKS
ncbi:TPA: DUF4059 family protein [Streptococcus pyogenes]|uniref:DUF4059 family protein n=1 Tax=Streptococcus pyogenes TaxID=1314 RepID=UPI000971CFE4|nr:DUF4059 family protein [Streptococcus pyogenes]HER4625763.1 DUF4059 family protein [Streptococcus pyogenes NGAS604]HER4674451.1 DUF4059 family protein [Streptococcus pyogenes NGAS344]ARV01701.1 amino acid ABC transporter [Streptococcus pyogenes]ASQ21601.1 amino acid ABC transporter [Streptococcus pyogenes]ASQ23476.1 amino acid ABC transporter [Streptococcus pyogenes]